MVQERTGERETGKRGHLRQTPREGSVLEKLECRASANLCVWFSLSRIVSEGRGKLGGKMGARFLDKSAKINSVNRK